MYFPGVISIIVWDLGVFINVLTSIGKSNPSDRKIFNNLLTLFFDVLDCKTHNWSLSFKLGSLHSMGLNWPNVLEISDCTSNSGSITFN